MSGDLQAAIAHAQAAQARSQGYRDAATRYDPSNGKDETMTPPIDDEQMTACGTLRARMDNIGWAPAEQVQVSRLLFEWLDKATREIERLTLALQAEREERRMADAVLDSHLLNVSAS